jgi:3',5'-cyclic AMP phosphodiesterase CpdA
MVKIQLISDLHLEFTQNIPITPIGDILVLAGDIATVNSIDSYDLFISECSKLYRHIVVVMGNHEYWSSKGMEYATKRYSNVCDKYDNVHFLDKSFVDLEGFRILGCTMWSNIPSEHAYVIEKCVNDYSRIKIKKGGRKYKITYNDVNEMHFQQKRWLSDQIERSNLPVIVVTHHSPLFETTPKSLDYAYHSDLTGLMSDKLKLWCHGHTHKYRNVREGNTIILSNPVGYPKEETGYLQEKFIELNIE